tara:strand:- start:219 stop:2480 length:2262 start_codon:yes stop_codon:yes gene_type:complete
MIRVTIRKPMIEEELLVEDIKNLGLPPIIVTRVLEEFSNSTFDAKKAQDIIGRMYKERSKQNVNFLATAVDKIQDEIEASAEDIGGIPSEFSEKLNKIIKFNITDKMRSDIPMALNFKEAKALEKSLAKAAKKSLSGDLQEDALKAIEANFNQRYLKQFTSLFQNQAGAKILNYLKKHPTNWKELAKLDFNEAMDYVEEVSLTEEDEKDIVHKYKDGYYWINLGEGACELEGKRMGHCGRDDRGNLVSLRTRPKGSKASKSHVTLTYNEYEDTLYQIKGRENNAPDSEYWPYIKDFIDRFGVDEVKEDGEHSSDDFSPLLEFIELNTNAKVDTERAELEDLADHINNGQEDTDYINFSADMDEYDLDAFAVRLNAYIQFKVEIPDIPANAVEGEEDEILRVLEGDDFLERISEISYMEDFIEEPMNTSVNAAVLRHGKNVTFHVQVDFPALDQDYSYATTRQDLQEAVNHYKYNFEEDDIDRYSDDIREIGMEFIKDMINTEGKGKMADIIANIHEIEKDYKRFYVDYNLNDPSEPVEFKLSSDLPVQIEAFSFEPPREITNSRFKRQYLGELSNGLSAYNEAIKTVFSVGAIRKIMNDSIVKISKSATKNALAQTRLDFPGYRLQQDDVEQYKIMIGNFFDELVIRRPSPMDLNQKKIEGLPKLGVRGIAEVKWLDTVEDIDFVMRWVEVIDGVWPQILEEMKPELENLNLKLKAEKKKIVGSMMRRIKDFADRLDIQLQENKRNIKLIVKK